MSGTPEDTFPEDSRRDEEQTRRAQSAVSIPATLLIVNGVLSILLAILGLVQVHTIPGQMDEAIKKIENDPALPKDQKDQQIEIMTKVKEWAEQGAFLIWYVVNVVASIVVIIGGVSMLRLSGPAIPIISAIIAMIPFVTWMCCCVLGFPAGIWALVVLSRSDVRAAMSRRATSGSGDEHDRWRDN